ncbi:MAG: hypothetical protein KAV44_09585 [Bacteroidales bacterium]|nr:hypothetical protein [Bacteroidales bacterium]
MKIYRLLIRSLDNKLSAKKQRRLNNYLSALPELQKERKIFVKIRDLIREQDYEPDNLFIKKVLSKIDAFKNEKIITVSFDNLLYDSFKKVAYSGIAATILLMLITYFSQGSLNPFSFLNPSGIFREPDLLSYALLNF